jgi:competence protein ComEA
MKSWPRTLTPDSRTLVILAITLLFLGCTSAERYAEHVSKGSATPTAEAININTATQDELQRIPFIGERLAEEIIEHRELHGPFRRTEHLMLIDGISERRFREIQHLVRVD